MDYGIKTIFRTPLKSILFSLLIILTTIFLALGLGIWQSAQDLLEKADETFITAGELVYTGGYYPEEDEYDPALEEAVDNIDTQSINLLPGVKSYETNFLHRASIDGYKPDRTESDFLNYAILQVEIISYDSERNYYSANIEETIYSWEDINKGSVQIYLNEDFDMELIKGNSYLISGKFFTVTSMSVRGFAPNTPTEAILGAGGNVYTQMPLCEDITEYTEEDLNKFWTTELGQYFVEITNLIEEQCNSFDLLATSNIEAVDSFHTGEYTLVEGEYFSQEDYQTGQSVIIPKSMAKSYSVGDTITINAHYPTTASSRFSSYWPEVGYANSEEYKIVGIYQGSSSDIYIPYVGQEWAQRSLNDYTLGRVVAYNSNADELKEALSDWLPVGFNLRLYDQGYEESAKPIMAVREMAFYMVIGSVICTAIVLIFFGYFFANGNAFSLKILQNLGASRRKTWEYLLSGVFLLTLLASAIGSIVSFLISVRMANYMLNFAQNTLTHDTRFSSSGFGIKSQNFAAVLEMKPIVFAVAGLAVIVVAILIYVLFILRDIKKADAKNRLRIRVKSKDAPKTVRKEASEWTYRVPSSSLRYTVRSVSRSLRRGIVVSLAFAILLLFLIAVSSMRSMYQSQLDTVYVDKPVTLRFTDYSGNMIENILVSPSSLELLEESEFVDETWYTDKEYYRFDGILVKADGTEVDTPLDRIEWPQSQFGLEAFLNQLNKNYSTLYNADNIERAPEFYYQETPTINWADGYSYDDYLAGLVAVIPRNFRQANGIELGDQIEIEVLVWGDYGLLKDYIPVTVGGDYISKQGTDNLYCIGADQAVIEYYENFYQEYYGESLNWNNSPVHYNSAGALLKNTDRLSEFRDWLEENFAQTKTAGINRIWVVIEDEALNQTIEMLETHITYTNITSLVLFVAALGLSFLVSNVMLRSRINEFALLRSIGQSAWGIFKSVLAEYLILYIPGIILAILAALILGQINIWITLMFVICFTAGAVISLLQTQRKSVLNSLSNRENA